MKYLNGIIDSISRVPAIDPDAQAFYNRVTAAGGSLTGTEQTAINTLVKSLKSNSIWTKMNVIYPMVGSSAAACAQNLKSASYTATFYGGWTFASTGATPNGTNGYMDTFYTASNTGYLVPQHTSKYNRNNNLIGTQVDGCYDVANASHLDNCYPCANFIIGEISTLISYTSTNTSGFFVGSRESTTIFNGYRNKISVGSNTNTATFIPFSLSYTIGALNQNGARYFYNVYECAFASLGIGLTNTDANNFYDTVQTFQTTLSRQV